MELEDLKQLHDKAYNHGEVPRGQGSNDLVFYHVTQWDENLLSSSSLQYRGQFDMLRKAGRQILSSLRANPAQVDFRPKADSRDDGADFLDGLYRTDDMHNQSIESYAIASQESVVCGVGAWKLYTEYETSAVGDMNQVIRRKPLYEANNKVYWDPNAKLQDKSDAKYVSILHSYSEDGYIELVQDLTGRDEVDINPVNFKTPEQSYTFPWYSESNWVYVVEFYHREKVKSKVFMVRTVLGDEILLSQKDVEENEEVFVDGGYEIIAEKDIETHQVTRYLASGAEILSEEVIAGQNIPVVPVYGERAFVEDEEYYEGITRLAKDPQRLRNFQMSYLADIVSRSPRQKPIFFPEQLQGHEYLYEESGADNNYPYLLMNAMDVNGKPVPPGPVGIMPEQPVPQALLQLNELSAQAINDVANPGLPQDIADPDISGKAVNAIQNRLDQQTAIYHDSMKHAKRRDGVIYASMAAEIYDAPRMVTLTTPDGQTKRAQVMESILDERTGEFKTLNDLTNIEFDVYSDIGPAYSTQKEQTLERLEQLMIASASNPEMLEMLQLQYISLMDGTNLDGIREYANKQMILKGYKEPETEEEIAFAQQIAQQQAAQGQQPDPNMVLAMAEMKKANAQEQGEVNDANKLQIDQFNAETKRIEALAKVEETGTDIAKKQAEVEGTRIDNIIKLRQPQQQTMQQSLRPRL